MSLILGETHVASPEACIALHDATGWDGTHLHWNIGRRKQMIVTHHSKGAPSYARNGDVEDYCELSETKDSADRWTGSPGVIKVRVVPAYDLGLLLRRSPMPIELTELDDGAWQARMPEGAVNPVMSSRPEDAVAWLCAAAAAKGVNA